MSLLLLTIALGSLVAVLGWLLYMFWKIIFDDEV
jgi:hypothetical protein